ncbi:MAG: hypothetical protein ACXACW_14740 [Candidatus Hodarchaeales archaeon]|jgi:hypothetical protein
MTKIGPRVTLIFADGTKRKIELYSRPPVIKVNLDKGKGNVIKEIEFIRDGVDTYRERVFEDASKQERSEKTS